MTKVKHVLDISGGKDSAALAIYLKNKYPSLDIQYYFCETGKELKETYNLITALESVLGKKIVMYVKYSNLNLNCWMKLTSQVMMSEKI